MYQCEQDFGEPSALIAALNDSVRPPIAATAATTLSRPLPALSHIDQCRINRSSYLHCFKVTSRFTGPNSTLAEAIDKVSTWPLHHGRATSLQLSTPNAYLYAKNDYCILRTYMLCDYDPTIIGTVICIPDSCVYKGGKITATAFGQTVSISKPGECMALAVGAQYSVETVTSGKLVIFEMPIVEQEEYTEHDREEDCPDVQWSQVPTFLSDLCAEVETLRTLALTAALNVELESYTGVVICLTHYYPVTHSPDPEDNHIYTDPDALKELDAVLYNLLVQEGYAVTVVTVYVNRKRLSSRSVCTTTGCVVDRSILPDAEGAKYKIRQELCCGGRKRSGQLSDRSVGYTKAHCLG